MSLLVWIYRVLTLFLLFVFAANALKRFVPLSVAGQAGGYLFVGVNVVLFLIVLATALRLKVPSNIVWAVTITWCLLFSWWAWIETQSSPFILHELHTFDAEAAQQEIRHFKLQAFCGFSILLIWFASFPLLQKYSSRRRLKSRILTAD